MLISLTVLSFSLSGCNNEIAMNQVDTTIENTTAQSVPAKNGILDSSDEVFKYLDVNQDKKVSKEEFKTLVDSLLNMTQNKDKMTTLAMQAFDVSDDSPKDGALTLNEFKILNEKNFDKIILGKNSLFTNKDTTKINPLVISKLFDTIKDAKDTISEKAFAKYLSQNKNIKSSDVQAVFTALDSNKNKTLTKDEFSLMFNTSNKNSIFGKVGGAIGTVAMGVGLVIFLPFAWLAEKLGVFDNIK